MTAAWHGVDYPGIGGLTEWNAIADAPCARMYVESYGVDVEEQEWV